MKLMCKMGNTTDTDVWMQEFCIGKKIDKWNTCVMWNAFVINISY